MLDAAQWSATQWSRCTSVNGTSTSPHRGDLEPQSLSAPEFSDLSADGVIVIGPVVDLVEEVPMDYGHQGQWLDPRTGELQRDMGFVVPLPSAATSAQRSRSAGPNGQIRSLLYSPPPPIDGTSAGECLTLSIKVQARVGDFVEVNRVGCGPPAHQRQHAQPERSQAASLLHTLDGTDRSPRRSAQLDNPPRASSGETATLRTRHLMHWRHPPTSPGPDLAGLVYERRELGPRWPCLTLQAGW
jgi:hypothetical protein